MKCPSCGTDSTDAPCSECGWRATPVLTQGQCYVVELETTNPLRHTVRMGCDYLTVEQGCLYVVAADMQAVGALFPEAKLIRRVGVGYK